MHLKKHAASLAGLGLVAAVPAVTAVDVGPVSVHGSVSQAAAWSDEYDYYGDTANDVALNMTDVIVNATYRWDNGLRFGAQVYGYKLADTSDVTLDWASLDYAFKPWLGVRLGRNKLAAGLYNDSQDLDTIRVFSLLPEGVYPKQFRPILASTDGLTLYGSTELGKAGSLDYQVSFGKSIDVAGDTLFVEGLQDYKRNESWQVDGFTYAGSVFWNTPLDGLRLGYSVVHIPQAHTKGVFLPTSEIHGTDLLLPSSVGSTLWNAAIAGTEASFYSVDSLLQYISAEYTRGKWTAAAEARWVDLDGRVYMPALGRLGTTRSEMARLFAYYGSLTYQVTDALGLGVYYSYADADSTADPVPSWKYESHDYAVAASYAVNEWVTLKGEYHFIDGTNTLDDTLPSADFTERHWNYVIVKAIFSF